MSKPKLCEIFEFFLHNKVTESNETAASTATASTSSIELCGFFEQYERNGKEALIEGVYSMVRKKKKSQN